MVTIAIDSVFKMDLHLVGRVTVYTAVIIKYFAVSGQTCSSSAFLDPQNVESYNQSRLVPLLGRHETLGREQWIFFDLQFTCHGMLTKWIFRGLPDQDIGVELTTWRLNTQTNFFTSYDQVSTTERNAGRPTRNGAVFTYELISPAEVLPGDVVGVEMGFISFGGTSNNVVALNTSGSGSTSLSYRTSGSGPSFILQSPLNIQERDIIPLLQAVVEPLQESTTVMELPTSQVATTARDFPTTAMDLPIQPTIATDLSTNLPTTGMDLSTQSTTAMDLPTQSTTAMDLPTEPTIAMDLSTDFPTTAMDLSTDLPTTTTYLSTDLPITTVNLSADSVETISASTMLMMTMGFRPRPDGIDQATGGIQKIIIAAGVCGGITEILIVVILCICVACVLKRIKKHADSDEPKDCGSGEQQSASISNGTLVQMNTAYKQAILKNSMDPIQHQTSTLESGQSMQFNSAYESHNRMHREMETENTGDYETMSGYVAYCEDNPTQQDKKTHTHLALPMVYEMSFQQQQLSMCTGEDEEHFYEYIR